MQDFDLYDDDVAFEGELLTLAEEEDPCALVRKPAGPLLSRCTTRLLQHPLSPRRTHPTALCSRCAGL